MTPLCHILRSTDLPFASAVFAIRDNRPDDARTHLQDALTLALAPILTDISRLHDTTAALTETLQPTPSTSSLEDPPDMPPSPTSPLRLLRAQIQENLRSSLTVEATQALANRQARDLASQVKDPLQQARTLSICQNYVRGYFDAINDN